MAEKMFEYQGKLQGRIVTGKVMAQTKEEAIASSKRLGILDPKIIDGTEDVRSDVPTQDKSSPLSSSIQNIVRPQSQSLPVGVVNSPATIPMPVPILNKTKRSQKVLIDKINLVKPIVDQLLAKNGNVLHMAMQTDTNGQMILAIVIEHDDDDKKS